MRRTADESSSKDVLLPDLRNILCFLMVYNSDILPYLPNALFRLPEKIVGIQIACDGEAQVTQTPLYKAVLVPRASPILARGEVSDISRRIGTTVKVFKVGNGDYCAGQTFPGRWRQPSSEAGGQGVRGALQGCNERDVAFEAIGTVPLCVGWAHGARLNAVFCAELFE